LRKERKLKDLSTPLIDAARERQEQFTRDIEALPPLRWYQWRYWRHRYWCWKNGF
jgi:hypothetical protein